MADQPCHGLLHVMLWLFCHAHAVHSVACRVGRVFKKRQCNS